MNETPVLPRDEFIESEIDRLLSILPNLNPVVSDKTYRDIIACVEDLYRIRMWTTPVEKSLTLTTPATGAADVPDPSEAEYHAPVMEPKVEPQVDPMPEPVEESSAEEKVSRTFTKEEVRAALAKARKKGVVINELLEEFGAKNFTGLPEAKYPELMARLEGI